MVAMSAGIGLAISAGTSASMGRLPREMAGVGSAVNDTTRNMGSVLGVAVFGSIAASVFASRAASARIGASSIGAAAEIARQAGGARGANMMHAAASAFVTGADHAVIAGVVAALAGAVIAARTLR
jgi:hypothetical protein